MFYQPETGRTFASHSEIRQAMWAGASVLFDDVITDDDLAAPGVGIFPLQAERPSVDVDQVADPAGVEQVNGVWTQQWMLRAATADERDEQAKQIEVARAERRQDIDLWRAAANASTFAFGGKQISCDSLSRSDIDGVANHIALRGTFPPGWPGGWKTTDKMMLPIPDIETFGTMYSAMTEQGTKNFNHSQELKARLAAAGTLEEIAAVVW